MNRSPPRVLLLLIATMAGTGGLAARATPAAGATNLVPVIARFEADAQRARGAEWVPVSLHDPPTRLAPPPVAPPGTTLAADSAWGGRETAAATFSAAADERVDAPRARQPWSPTDEEADDGSTRLTSGRRGWLAATVTLLEDARQLNEEAEETAWSELLEGEERGDEASAPDSLWRESTPWGLESDPNRSLGLTPDRPEQIGESGLATPSPWLDLRPDSDRELKDDTALPTLRPADYNR